MKKSLPSIIASLLIASSPSYGEERVPTTIVNHNTNTIMQAAYTIRPGKSFTLYDESGQLLEELPFNTKVRYGRGESETRSGYLGEKFSAIVDDSEGLVLVSLIEAPKPDLEAFRNAPRLSKKEWIDNLTWKVQESFKRGDQLGYESALEALKKARALPDDPK